MDFETATNLSDRYKELDYEVEHHEPHSVIPEDLSLVDRYNALSERIAALHGSIDEGAFISHQVRFGDKHLHHLTLLVSISEEEGVSDSITAWWNSSGKLDVEESVTLEEIQGLEANSEGEEDVEPDPNRGVAVDAYRRLGLLEESVAAAEWHAEITKELDEAVANGEVFMNNDELRAHHARSRSNDIIRRALEAEAPPVSREGQVTKEMGIEDARGNMRHLEFIGEIPQSDDPEE